MSYQTRSEVSSTSGFPVFTHNLWKILEDRRNKDAIKYDGHDSFVITNATKFMHIMLQYYKTNNLKKFYKLLEVWGFTKTSDKLTFKHQKWDKNNKACLHQITKRQIVQQKTRVGVSHHLRSHLSPEKLAQKLEDEIQHRIALEREVADLKTLVNQLVQKVGGAGSETPISQSPEVRSFGKSDPSFSSKRSVESAEMVSQSSRKRRKITGKNPEIIIQNDGSNPFLLRNQNPFLVRNAGITNQKENPATPPGPKCKKSNDVSVIDDEIRSPQKVKVVYQEIVDCPENITMLRPGSKKVTSEIPDNVSLKTENLQAQISWE